MLRADATASSATVKVQPETFRNGANPFPVFGQTKLNRVLSRIFRGACQGLLVLA